MDEGYDGYRMMLREMFPEHDTKRVFVVNGSPGSEKTPHLHKSNADAAFILWSE